LLAKRVQHLVVDPPKRTVRHYYDYLGSNEAWRQIRDYVIRGGDEMSFPASRPEMIQHLARGHRGFRSVTLGVKEARYYYFITFGKRVFELLLE